MSIALQGRVIALEAEVKALRQQFDTLLSAMTEPEPKTPAAPPAAAVNAQGPRQMCPRCGVKPNYHLHVTNCRGPWQGEGAKP